MLHFFVLATLPWSMSAAASRVSSDAPLVTIQSPVEVSIAPGESRDVEIHITVAEGFHVQANPAANEFLIPLELELESNEDIDIDLDIVEVRYPAGATYRITGTEESLLTLLSLCRGRLGQLAFSGSRRKRSAAGQGRRGLLGRAADIGFELAAPQGSSIFSAGHSLSCNASRCCHLENACERAIPPIFGTTPLPDYPCSFARRLLAVRIGRHAISSYRIFGRRRTDHSQWTRDRNRGYSRCLDRWRADLPVAPRDGRKFVSRWITKSRPHGSGFCIAARGPAC